MVNVRELRVGNTVAGALGQTYTVTPELIQIVSANPDWVDPIPLSPEILEKAGFIRDNEWPRIFLHPKIDSTRIKLMGNWWLVKSVNGDALTSLNYIHQLQNLYFAITGEELEIKSPT